MIHGRPTFVLLAAAAAASARAQPFEAVLTTELSTDGVTFSRFVAAVPGATIQGRVVVRFTGAAFADATYQVRGDSIAFSAPCTASAVTRPAPFNFGPQTLAVFPAALGFRIDDARDAADSVNLGILSQQRPPQAGSPVNPANPAVLLRFAVDPPPGEPGLLHVHIPFDQVRGAAVRLYDDVAAPPRLHATTNIAVDGAWLYIGGNPCLGQSLTTPPSQRVLAGTDVTFTSTGELGPFVWYADNVELLDSSRIRGAETNSITIRNVAPDDSADLFLFGLCSHTGLIRLDVFCPSDFNNDGFVDFFDYDAFLLCFETGDCPTGDPPRTADFNADGFADFFDYDDFVAAYEAGC